MAAQPPLRRASPKADNGSVRPADASALLRVVSDPTRLHIFLLLRDGETCVCELASTLGLAENLVSHHLGVLRRAGLVRDRRDPADARWVYYALDTVALSQCYEQVQAMFDPHTLGTRTPTCGPAARGSAPLVQCEPDICNPTTCDISEN